jgi:hypothetical protein
MSTSKKFNRDVKMQATSLKESNIDPNLQTKVPGTNEIGMQKPPQINKDLTNKVFSNINQMSAQSKAVAESDRKPKGKADDTVSAEKKESKSNGK